MPSSSAEHSNKKSQPVLSLRLVISMCIAAAILVVAATCTAITYTVSIDALRELGTNQAIVLADATQKQTENFFNATAAVATSVQDMLILRELPFPTNMTNVTKERPWHYDYLNIAMSASMALGSQVSFILLFADNSGVMSIESINPAPLPRTIGINSWLGSDFHGPPANRNITKLESDYLLLPELEYANKTHPIFAYNQAGAGQLSYPWDIFAPPLAQLTGSMSTTDVYFSSFRISSGDLYFLIVTFFPRRDGTPYAAGIQTLPTKQMAAFVKSLRTTPNSRVYLTSRGFIVAASDPALAKPIVRPAPVIGMLPPQCELDLLDSTKMGCVPQIRDTTDPLLRSLPNSILRSSGTSARQYTFDGEEYYLATAETHTPMRLYELQVTILIPSEDIIGSVEEGRNIVIILACGLFVVASLVAFLLVSLFLAPLGRISARMYEAARLRDDKNKEGGDDADEESSALSEIHALQDAYYSMNGELNRLKSFVPEAVLRGAFTDADEYDEYVDMYEEEENDGNGASTANDANNANSGGFVTLNTQQQDQEDVTTSRDGGDADDVRSTYSTHKRSAGGPNPKAAPTSKTLAASSPQRLNTGTFLKRQRVTVLMLNLRNFSANYTLPDLDRLVQQQELLVRTVMEVVQSLKGVVDTFNGDRFLISFNAICPAAMHANRAARCAARLIAVFKSMSPPSPSTSLVSSNLGRRPSASMRSSVSGGSSAADGQSVVSFVPSMGIASGTAIVGNCGSEGMKRFNTMGDVLTRAAILERLCKIYPAHLEVQAIIPQNIYAEAVSHVQFQSIDVVRLPQHATVAGPPQSPTSKPSAIASIIREGYDQQPSKQSKQKSAAAKKLGTSPSASINKSNVGVGGGGTGGGDSEWMYELQSEARSLLEDQSRVFKELARGRRAEAERILEGMDESTYRQHGLINAYQLAHDTLGRGAAAVVSESPAGLSFSDTTDNHLITDTLSRGLVSLTHPPQQQQHQQIRNNNNNNNNNNNASALRDLGVFYNAAMLGDVSFVGSQ